MSIIVSFNEGGLTIYFENIEAINDFDNYIKLIGTRMVITVNAMEICSTGSVVLQKTWLLNADEVYFDTRIKKEEN